MRKPKKITLQSILVGEGYQLTEEDFELLAAHLRASPVPAFADDPALCMDALNRRCAQVMLAPKFREDGTTELAGWVCLFDNGQWHITVPFPTEGLAAACALLYLVRSDKSAVT